ncbi:EAL domain-containing protein [Rhodoferax sp.]|uniref:EAL domain-containing protein n=1 Tax=Rhodoferax sp. TaxID=50421 RepID=UPI0025F3F8B4|nr:EAL domain-containing protein [Rhodoferax sp.]
MAKSRGGFALQVPAALAQARVACRATFRGPAKFTANAWSSEALSQAQLLHKKTGVAIEAAIGVLAVFMLLTAFVNFNALYLAFVGGLILNMRMAALSVGTDFSFLGLQIPPEYLIPMRQWTLCLYFANSVGLFCVLFKKELFGIKRQWPLVALQVLSLGFLFAALFVSYESLLPSLWVGTFLGSLVIAAYLGCFLWKTESRVAAWYGASTFLTLIATLNEVLIASTGQRFFEYGLNSVTAAIGSALLASAAVAEHMRTHRLQNVKAQLLLEAAYQDSPIGLFSVTEGTHISKTNPAFEGMLAPLGKQGTSELADLFDLTVQRRIFALRAARQAGILELQTRVESANQSDYRWFAVRASTADGAIVECSLQDITAQVLATASLEELASHDPLTGCLNLRGLGLETERSSRRPSALAYFDLDRFKLINDLYGHSAGDEVLKQVTQRMRSVLRPADVLARIGGDEFVIVFYDGAISECEHLCNTITTLIGAAPFQIETQSFALDISTGLVGADQCQAMDLKGLISAADMLCRMAKKRPQQRMFVMTSGDRFLQQHQDELELIDCFERGQTPEGLFLLMQPEVSLSRPFDSLNFEVLIRLLKANGEVVGAGTIIEAAEAHGKTAIIDRWVLGTTVRWIEENADKLQATRFVGVNLSGGSLNDEAFTQELFTLFEQHPVALEKLCIEITETVAITDMKNMQHFIDRVRSMGGKVALDDFGAGYSSFGYLKQLSVDSLKLDGSLVRDAVRIYAGQAIIVAIGGLVRSLGMKSVGEFAEDLPTIKVLFDAGIDYAQGYGISRPVTPEQILAASSGADFIQDPEIRAFFEAIQEEGSVSMPLFRDSRRD